MSLKRKILSSIAVTALACGALTMPSFAAGDHLITMQQADIRAFINNVSIVTGKTFIVDPRVQGKVTISSEQSLSPVEVFEVFKDVMRVHGYTLVRTATGEYRITLIQGAAQDAPFTVGDGVNGRFATTVIKLSQTDASEAARLIKPVMHSQGQLTANPGGNVLVITDFPENLRKAREIIAAMDTSDTRVETFRLNSLSAIDAEEALKSLAGAKPKYRVVAIPGTNSLIVQGRALDIEKLRPIISSMDVGSVSPRGAVSVVPLRFANGENIIELLTTLLPAYQIDGQAAPTVAYEQGSNTLVISASGDTQEALEQIIRRLDVRRPQVLVEAIIVEISDTAAKELGVEFAIAGLNGNAVPLLSSNFSRAAPNILGLAGVIAGGQDGFDATEQAAAISSIVGLDGGIAGIGGISGDTLYSAVVNALETDEDTNILSMPFVTTLDNVPATFLVGQEIPITTGESLLGAGAGNINPFRTFERQEVGIQLDVLPQISEGDVVRLEINQEVSSISGALTSISGDFVTNKRSIQTTVLANDKEIIVLGGLLQDDEEISLSKVPLLGDIPVLGKAFQSKGTSRRKTNLMVFLRPTIIRNASDARPLTERSLNRMRFEDRQQSGRGVSKIDSFLNETGSQQINGNLISSNAYVAPMAYNQSGDAAKVIQSLPEPTQSLEQAQSYVATEKVYVSPAVNQGIDQADINLQSRSITYQGPVSQTIQNDFESNISTYQELPSQIINPTERVDIASFEETNKAADIAPSASFQLANYYPASETPPSFTKPLYTEKYTDNVISENIDNMHVVIKGDTVYSLARKACVSVNDLKALNGLDSDFNIVVGESLNVPNGQC